MNKPEIPTGPGPSDRLKAPIVADRRSSRGTPDRPAAVGEQTPLPRVGPKDLPYGPTNIADIEKGVR